MMNTETKCNKKIKTSLHENIDWKTNATRLAIIAIHIQLKTTGD